MEADELRQPNNRMQINVSNEREGPPEPVKVSVSEVMNTPQGDTALNKNYETQLNESP